MAFLKGKVQLQSWWYPYQFDAKNKSHHIYNKQIQKSKKSPINKDFHWRRAFQRLGVMDRKTLIIQWQWWNDYEKPFSVETCKEHYVKFDTASSFWVFVFSFVIFMCMITWIINKFGAKEMAGTFPMDYNWQRRSNYGDMQDFSSWQIINIWGDMSRLELYNSIFIASDWCQKALMMIKKQLWWYARF